MRKATPPFAVVLGGALLALLATPDARSMPRDISVSVVQKPKFDPQSEYMAGMASLADQNYRDAKSHFEHVLTIMPDHPRALYGVGVAEAALGDLKGAARDYQAALRSEPNLIDAWRQLALTNARLGRADQARVQLARLKRFAETCASACPQASDISASITEVETTLSGQPTMAKTPGG
jgi:tetratricopeptide (TPR) repeat protein